MSAKNLERKATFGDVFMAATEAFSPGEAASPENTKELTLREHLDNLVGAARSLGAVETHRAGLVSFRESMGVFPKVIIDAEEDLVEAQIEIKLAMEVTIQGIVDIFGDETPVPDQG